MLKYSKLLLSTGMSISLLSSGAIAAYKGNLNTDANAKGFSSIAIGSKDTESAGIGSIAIGDGLGANTKSDQNFSVVIGAKAKSLSVSEKGAGASVVIGYDSETKAETFSTLVGARSKIDQDGNYSTLIGTTASVTKLPKNSSSLDVSGKKITVSSDGHVSVFSPVDPHAKEKYGSQYASSVMGYKSSSHNIQGTALGSFSTVTGEFGTALGSQSASIGDRSSAVGLESNSIGKNSVALGSYSTSQEDNSVSIGYLSEANSKNSVALGAKSKTYQKYENTVSKYTAVNNSDSENGVISIGREKTSTESKINRRITNLAGGVNSTDAVNMAQLDIVTKAIGMSEDEIKNIKKNPNLSLVAKMKAEQSAREQGDVNTLKMANQYTDDKVTSSNIRTDDLISKEQKSRQHNDTVLSQRLNEEMKNRKKSDKETLEIANSYTNYRVNTLDSTMDKMLNNFQQNTEQRFSQMNNKINRVEKRANAGIAGVTAISSIPYVNNERFSFGMGVGHYRDAQAIAAGVQYKVKQNTNVRVNASWNNGGDTNLGAGFAVGW
ncbi:YadA-like family protein [Proteus mirabilis]|uniref:YadA-like family protein n=1 Tax=Proteus mirabilis TaxID=584 RepID=UPI0023EEAED2|nr:YadA-like family protein [Proteus mirabilis]